MTHYNYLIYENNIPVYVGDRSTKFKDPLLDIKYMGGGRLIGQAIKEKGIENFTKEILAICKSRIDTHKNEETFIKYFKTHTSESGYNINKYGGSSNGESPSKETKQNMSEVAKDMVWIYKSSKNKRIKKEKLQYYLDNNWKLGRTEEYKQKLSEFSNGTIWITKNNKNKRIKKEKLQQYLDDGWEQGFSEKTKKKHSKAKEKNTYVRGTKWIHKGTKNKRVKKEELEHYLDNKWELGVFKIKERYNQCVY